MTNYGEHWTDEKPEVGKRYWFTYWYWTLELWGTPVLTTWYANEKWNAKENLRSIAPIPDPVPPPLPEVKP